MRRSQINDIIRQGEAFIASFGFRLPPFAHWTPADWESRRDEADMILGARLGWDITDYGQGDFARTGLLLFTLRNGDAAALGRGRGMVYAEKIMISRDGQLCPMHHHGSKTEDIIVRGGAPIEVKLYNSGVDGALDRDAPVRVRTDGIAREVTPGGTLVIGPGESITLEAGTAHAFWASGGDSLIGEVSTVNDDETDNHFHQPVARFPDIEEDEPPYRLIVPDYARLVA